MALLVTPLGETGGRVRRGVNVECVDCGGGLVLSSQLLRMITVLTRLGTLHECPAIPVEAQGGARCGS